jgi:hypothetical protein
MYSYGTRPDRRSELVQSLILVRGFKRHSTYLLWPLLLADPYITQPARAAADPAFLPICTLSTGWVGYAIQIAKKRL